VSANRGLVAIRCSRILATADNACVAISEDAEEDFDGLDERKQAQMLRIMDLWCRNHRLTPEQFNPNEARARKGDLNVLVQAFKVWKVRFYGAVFQIDGTKHFITLETDLAKKQNKADPKILNRAKTKAIEVAEKLARIAKDRGN